MKTTLVASLAICFAAINASSQTNLPPKLTRHSATELNFQTTVGTTYQIQAYSRISGWTNFDNPIFGDGANWSKTFSTWKQQYKFRLTTPTNSAAVAFYPLNGNAYDYSGNHNDGTIVGATPTKDRFGNTNGAYYFQGDGSTYISIPDSSSLDVSNTITVAAWIKPQPGGYAEPRILTKGSYQLGLSDTTSTPQIFFTLEPNGGILSGSISLCDNEWIFIAGTYDGSVMKLYTNGVLAAEGNASGTIGVTDQTLGIGENLDDYSDYFHGSIDDVQVYNRAFTQSEVQQLFSSPY